MSQSHGTSSSKSDNYVVVARRYRPRGFDELVGQEHVGRALCNAIETGRVGHAYLFTGARGVGKTSTARIFAKALNNPDGPTAQPDNQSDVALAIDSGEDVDVIEIDGASNRGIDEIRSLRANAGVRPSRSRYKIYIIDEVHMLTQAAFNALLKTLEEPPEHVKFIFCTTDPEKIPITVLSRCQRFDFAPVEVSRIVGRLKQIVVAENAEADDDALELIARRAAGSMRDSQSLLEQVLSFCGGKLTADQIHSMLGTADEDRLHAMAKALAERNPAETLKQLDAAIDAGVDAGRLAEQLLGYFRDLMALAVGCEVTMLRHTSASLAPELKSLADQWGLQTVLAIVSLLDQTLVRIRHSVYARVLLEATLIQACQLPDLQLLADLASAAGQAASNRSTTEKKNAPRMNAPHLERAVADPHQKVMAHAGGPTLPPARPGGPSAASTASSAQPVQSHAVSTSPVIPGTTSASNGAQTHSPQSSTELSQPHTAPPQVTTEPIAVTWTATGVHEIWQAVIQRLEAMTQTLARSVHRVECLAPGRIRLVFAASAKLAMSRCDTPVHREAISSVLNEITGQSVAFELTCDAPVAKPVEAPKSSGKSRMQRMRELENNDLIKACISLFDAEIVKIDPPRAT